MRDNFDWVTAHAKCTAAMMLAALAEGINRDVEKRNELVKGIEPQFRVESDLAASTVVVHRSEPADREQHAQVAFSASLPRTIIVGGYGIESSIRARVCLDGEGQCGMTMDGTPISKVRLRMVALGPLFFAPVDAALSP